MQSGIFDFHTTQHAFSIPVSRFFAVEVILSGQLLIGVLFDHKVGITQWQVFKT